LNIFKIKNIVFAYKLSIPLALGHYKTNGLNT
jgi:hypothetical protein